LVESEQLLRLVDCRDSWGHDSLHHEAEFRGKKDFLEKRQNVAIEEVPNLSATRRSAKGTKCLLATLHFHLRACTAVSNPSLLPLACSITFREKFSYSFVIEFVRATDFTALLGGPMG
jgi:hypothetical protein